MRPFASTLAVLSILNSITACNAAAPEAGMNCPASFERLLSDSEFRKYSVAVDGAKSDFAAPETGAGKAHTYRTIIAEAAKKGPNFAGHYTIVPIGCGAATVCVAIVNQNSGKVLFPADLKNIESLLVDTGSDNISSLNFRVNSNLLITVGTPNGDLSQAGISYFLMDDNRLKKIGFSSVSELCGIPDYGARLKANIGN